MGSLHEVCIRHVFFSSIKIGQGSVVYYVVDGFPSSRSQTVRVVQRPAYSQWLMSSSRQETGARLPSAARRIMPTVYSSGFLVKHIARPGLRGYSGLAGFVKKWKRSVPDI